MAFQSASLREALEVLGEILADRGLVHDVAVVGGGALLLSRHIDRPTNLDVVARVVGDTWMLVEPMPTDLVEAVRDVGVALDLAPDWLNAGPTSLFTAGLPVGFAGRAEVHRFGPLTVRLASRVDQIAFKVYAAAAAGQTPARPAGADADEGRAGRRRPLVHHPRRIRRTQRLGGRR